MRPQTNEEIIWRIKPQLLVSFFSDITQSTLTSSITVWKKKTTLEADSLYNRKTELWDTKIIYDPFYPASHQFFQLFSWNVPQIPLRKDHRLSEEYLPTSGKLLTLILIPYDCLTGVAAAAALSTNNCILSVLHGLTHCIYCTDWKTCLLFSHNLPLCDYSVKLCIVLYYTCCVLCTDSWSITCSMVWVFHLFLNKLFTFTIWCNHIVQKVQIWEKNVNLKLF